jgi:hypothetical protein
VNSVLAISKPHQLGDCTQIPKKPQPSYVSSSGNSSASVAVGYGQVLANDLIEKNFSVMETFKEQAKNLNQIWTDFQASLFPKPEISEDEFKQDMEDFCVLCLKKCFKDKLGNFHSPLAHIIDCTDSFHPEITNSARADKEAVLNAFEKYDLNKKVMIINRLQNRCSHRYENDPAWNLSKAVLKELLKNPFEIDNHDQQQINKAKARRILKYLSSIMGQEVVVDMVPRNLISLTEKVIFDKIEKFKTIAKNQGFEFVGNGDLGLVFSREVDQHKAIFKLSIYPPESFLGRQLEAQEKQILSLDKISIDPKSKCFLPELLRDKDGSILGIPGRVLVMKHFDGKPLIDQQKIGDNLENIVNDDYEQFDIDPDFAVDFMDFYLKAAREGIDLNDIRPGNCLYKPLYFQIVEFGALQNEETKFVNKLREKSPEAFLIYTLMESIFMCGTNSPRTYLPKQIYPLLQKGESTSAHGPKILAGHKFGKMLSSFDLAIERGVIKREEILKGVKDLKELYDLDIPFMYPNKQDSLNEISDLDFLVQMEGYYAKKSSSTRLPYSIPRKLFSTFLAHLNSILGLKSRKN